MLVAFSVVPLIKSCFTKRLPIGHLEKWRIFEKDGD